MNSFITRVMAASMARQLMESEDMHNFPADGLVEAFVRGAEWQAKQTPEGMAELATAIHYPACWDTAAYPTLASALHELYAWFKCSTCGAEGSENETKQT